ncbi:MAG: alpha/beta fold hydrolase [Clostridia bacterium]|nr:alpha/beta fold hydrolase [Clostridia bacterium]
MIALIILGALAILVLLAALGCYFKTFYSWKKAPDELPDREELKAAALATADLAAELEALPFEGVEITAFDGVRLFGRYYHFQDGAPLQIQFHGYKGTAYRDFCGGHYLARKNGFNVLLVDHRAHGNSGGKTISFGVRERKDCLAWANYAFHRFGEDTPIVLAGISMGAATVLGASELDLPKTVVGVIADCPFSKPSGSIKVVIKSMGFPVALAYPLVWLGARIFGRFSIDSATPLSAITNAKVPVLLIHGKADKLVPYSMSEELHAAANGKATLHGFEGAGHGVSYLIDPQKYERVVLDFLKTQCKL